MSLKVQDQGGGEFKFQGTSLPRVSIIKAPTPVTVGQIDDFRFFVKREDLTDTTIYGGNKVRNLEFLFAQALLKQRRSVHTPIPVGSNFSAALAGHASNLGLVPMLCQVDLASHEQIVQHDAFCRRQKAIHIVRRGPLKFLGQAFDVARIGLKNESFFIPPGGSNAFGGVGHFRAFLEVMDEMKAGRIPQITDIFLGVGTGGTAAGIMAAISAFDLPITLHGVRCASPFICNDLNVARIASSVLKILGVNKSVQMSKFKLQDCEGSDGYGVPLKNYDSIRHKFLEQNGIELDRTYTSKVVKTMADAFHRHKDLQKKAVLYWHTYSPLAETITHLQ